MAKASINKNYKLSAKGVLGLDENGIVGIENPDDGKFIELSRLFIDFLDKPVSISVSYDEDDE